MAAVSAATRRLFLPVAVLAVGLLGLSAQTAAAAPCDPPIQNPIVCENSKPGNPPSEWDVEGAGDPSIQGFATDISVNHGETVHFKIDTASTAYHLDIYRMGYYGGDGARKVATVQPSASLPQVQPACLNEPETGLVDCGNWSESASWAVPGDAVSGIYFAKLVRDDAESEGSHILFIVRDDSSHSALLFQTSDTTWEAYNRYGGNSLYQGGAEQTLAERAYKVSYNRPFTTRGPLPEDSPFNAEYPMVRFLERNGYDVSYFTGVDADRRGGEILNHKTYLSVGHDEYWSGTQRANVEAARNAGVNLAFFSGNESFWKTRWENSIDGSGTEHRTLVSYKETHANAKIDPTAAWTGTWRDPRFSPPADGGRPENALTGTIFMVNSGTSAIEVPAADGKMRLWRNTSIANLAPGATATLAEGTLGYEWDEDLDNGSRPAGLVDLSSTSRNGVEVLQDNGSTYGPGQATHHLTLYRAPSGALVFGAGTVQWSWGLDGNHDRGGSTADPRMQQATVNLLADMGSQPASLQGDLVPATASTDTQAPTSTILAPTAGSNVASGQPTTISGTATDAVGETEGGQVGGVEVSTDGGVSWHPAQGRNSWTYSWTPGAAGSATIKVRAVDDSGNLESPGAGVTVNVTARTCPCSIWDSSVTPPVETDNAAVELGVKFRSDVNGFITGIRFYKGSQNTGTHVGHLWSTDGTMLAEATFTEESSSGWQEASFGAPVPITAGTTYIASYHAPQGNYAASGNYFASGFDSPPLHALADGVDGADGVYKYGSSGSFPTETYNASNYWVDVVFNDNVGPDTTPPTISSRSPASGNSGVATGGDVTATFNEPMAPATIDGTTVQLRDPSNAVVPATVSYSAGQRRATLHPSSPLQNSTAYTATVKGGAGGVSWHPAQGRNSWTYSWTPGAAGSAT
ncbi:MAG TPA: N,N-dimethylformamidase beta subunit family domain-containing protein, partial [Solirubrobacterales bacterium]|nr:N,N-dimethylformamidase beta subunit family domain-containing protein [Solirubrobacterales bacterium]